MFDDWISPQKAIDLLAVNGVTAQWAHKVLNRNARNGKVRCKASAIATPFNGRAVLSLLNETVPWLWREIDLPPLGHPFWRSGMVRMPASDREVRGVTFNRYDIEATLADAETVMRSRTEPDSPLPPDDIITAKLVEMATTMGRDRAARTIRTEPGFLGVTNEHARRLMAGTRKPGRPKKTKPA